MKYRILSDEELSHFEEELKAFLIVNGIEGEAWEKINKETPEKAIQLVEIFSDKVLQVIYEKMQVLEHRMKNSCMVFRMQEKEMLLIAMNAKTDDIDLSTPEGIHEGLQKSTAEIDFFTSKRAYSKEREEEIHQLLMDGAVPSSIEFWDSLMSLFE